MALRPSHLVLSGLCLLTALVVQLVVLDGLPFPLAPPTLVVLVLACLALVEGPLAGAVLGFGSGLLADLLSDHVVGMLALVLTLVGYVVGLVSDDSERTALVPLAAVMMAAGGSIVLYAATSYVLGDERAAVVDLPRLAGGSILYDLLLTPFVYPVLRSLFTRLDGSRAT